MAYSSTNPVRLHSQGIAGMRLWEYNTSEGSTVVLTATGYFSDGVARGMQLGDIIIAYGDSGGTTRTFGIGVVSSRNTTAGTVGGALLSLVISTNP